MLIYLYIYKYSLYTSFDILDIIIFINNNKIVMKAINNLDLNNLLFYI